MNIIEYTITKDREINKYVTELEEYQKIFHRAVSTVLLIISIFMTLSIPSLSGSVISIVITLSFLIVIDFILTMKSKKYLAIKSAPYVKRKIRYYTQDIINEAKIKGVEITLPVNNRAITEYKNTVFSEIEDLSQFIRNNKIKASFKDIIIISLISATQKMKLQLIEPYKISKRQSAIIEGIKKYYAIDVDKYCVTKDDIKNYYDIEIIYYEKGLDFTNELNRY